MEQATRVNKVLNKPDSSHMLNVNRQGRCKLSQQTVKIKLKFRC